MLREKSPLGPHVQDNHGGADGTVDLHGGVVVKLFCTLVRFCVPAICARPFSWCVDVAQSESSAMTAPIGVVPFHEGVVCEFFSMPLMRVFAHSRSCSAVKILCQNALVLLLFVVPSQDPPMAGLC